MKIEFLIFYGISALLIIIILNKPLASQNLLFELLKIFISGYLGYLIKSQEK